MTDSNIPGNKIVHTDRNRREIAEWIFARTHLWVNSVETKVRMIVAIDTAMLGILGAALSRVDHAGWAVWMWLLVFVTATMLGASLFCTAMSILPRIITDKEESLLFFGSVRTLSKEEYTFRLKTASDEELLNDWAAQIHNNARIAHTKFAWVRRSMWLYFLAVPLWFLAVIILFSDL